MKNFKNLVYVTLCCVAFVGSLVLSGCGHGHSHGHGSHSHGHGDHSNSQSDHSKGHSVSNGHSGHSHGHSNTGSGTPHHGIATSLFDAADQQVGYVELKLHDDKGDLELWLTALPNSTPFDIPLDSKIKVVFLDIGKKEVLLSVRNKANNEDEDGNGNIRNGKTNYFIFPGDTEQSANFLVGKSFSSQVLVYFSVDGKLFKTTSFELKPHTH